MKPPSVGPIVGPTMTPTPNIAWPMPTSFGGNASKSVACAVERSAPPPSPCTTRQNTRPPSEPAAPQKNDATTKSAIEPVRYRRRPKQPDSQPDIGMTMTFAMMYPVDTHEISSSVAPRFPIMWGIATFTMDVSISSSTAASVTAMAMRYLWRYLSSRGFGRNVGGAVPRGPEVIDGCALGAMNVCYFVSTCATTDMPGRSG